MLLNAACAVAEMGIIFKFLAVFYFFNSLLLMLNLVWNFNLALK